MKNQIIVTKLENKIQESIQEVQQEIESSFNRIGNFLDSIINDPCLSIPNSTLIFAISMTQVYSPSTKTLTDQLIQEVQPIIKSIIKKEIKQKEENFDQPEQQFKQLQSNKVEDQEKVSTIIQFKKLQLVNKPFNYKLIENKSVKQDGLCRAIAINKDDSIVLAACISEIKVFEFKQEYLKQIQLLSEHKSGVTTLNFMKKSTHFISGSQDSQIIIWTLNLNSLWVSQQKLDGHTDYINCLVLNNNEDIIISGSDDKTIKFWVKNNQWQNQQTITDHTSHVAGLSLNDQQNTLISCGNDKLILIIQQSTQDKNWNIIQKITVEVQVRRLCFVDDNLFTVQPFATEQMYIYEMNRAIKLYQKQKQISVKCGSNDCYYYFTQQFIKSKNLIVSKNGYNINLIRKNENGYFITQQSIEFGNNYVFGQMSENGDYLLTWDYKSKEFQIRKFNEGG